MFDTMFGGGAAAANQPETQKRFDELKRKYASVLRTMEQTGIRLSILRVENNKLFLKGTVPSEDAKNKIWDQIKLVDPNYSDLTADITAEPETRATSAAPSAGGQTYTVKPGDTLTKISEQFYGDTSEYMHIFNANQDKLKDPDKIQPGQVLTIPPK
ncbi:MAG: LysM peptidoglycan-binding domain-containing protein [Bryobacteraceae bacterium]